MATRAVGCLPLLYLIGTMTGAQAVMAGTEPLAYRTTDLEIDGKPHRVTVPVGYRIEVLATGMLGPRLLTFAPNADLYIGSKSGQLYRLQPPYREADILIQLDAYPHSIAFREGEILIAQTDGLYRAAYEPGQARIRPQDIERLARLPGGGGHNSRTLGIGPDGRVYLGLGISGNCSDEYLGEAYPFDDRRGGILVLDESGDKLLWRPFASGLRNPVGFDWHPVTGDMYATNNGPDHWGFELPPEYFSRVAPGSFHGMPWYQFDGQTLRADRCARSRPPRSRAEVPHPVATFPARSAPMAVAFAPPGTMTPELEGDALVALHGSWATRPWGQPFGDRASRREPKLVAVRFSEGTATRVDDLVTGFQLPDGERWARPVGVAVGPDGALYFTSDHGLNALFRLSPMAAAAPQAGHDGKP